MLIDESAAPLTYPLRYGEEQHDRIVRDFNDREIFYRQQLQEPFRRMVKWWRLYLADRDDNRLPHEKWRAHTFVPYAYSGVETKVAVLTDIFNSADPVIQAEGVGSEDLERAKGMERLLAYTLTKNRWQFSQSMHFRELAIQGTAVWKIIHTKKAHTVTIHPTPQDLAAFQQSIEMAVAKGAPDPPDPAQDPTAFLTWRETVNTARSYGFILDPPTPGPKEIIEYQGPWFERVSLFDLRFDPLIESVDDQPFYYHRIVKPKSWLLERTGPEAWKPFDPAQVDAVLRRMPEFRFSEFDDQVSDMLGIPTTGSSTVDPTFKDAVELFEVWSREPGYPPYSVMLNRAAIINKTPDTLPYFHGKWPFVPTRNVCIPRRALGLSDFQEAYSMYHSMNLFRDLRLDALLLSVLPVYTKLKDMGFPQLQRLLQPGMILDLPVANGIQTLQRPNIPPEVFREEIALKEDIDETNATPPQVRGSQATVGRISATEQASRLNQALQRQKNTVLSIEDEWQPIPRQSAGLWYQFSDSALRLRIGGEDNGADPFLTMERDDLLQALDMDFRFRGASKALNRELSAQQLKDAMQTSFNMGLLLPEEGRKFITLILEILGHKGVSQLITPAGTQALVDARLAQQQQQAQAAQLARMPGLPGGAPPPGAMPGGTGPSAPSTGAPPGAPPDAGGGAPPAGGPPGP